MHDQPSPPPQFWTAPEGPDGAQRLGLEEAFLETLGAELVALELAPPGTRLHAGDTFGLLTLATRSVDLRAPEAFRVLQVNTAAEQDPRLVRHSPYARGWLLLIERTEK